MDQVSWRLPAKTQVSTCCSGYGLHTRKIIPIFISFLECHFFFFLSRFQLRFCSSKVWSSSSHSPSWKFFLQNLASKWLFFHCCSYSIEASPTPPSSSVHESQVSLQVCFNKDLVIFSVINRWNCSSPLSPSWKKKIQKNWHQYFLVRILQSNRLNVWFNHSNGRARVAVSNAYACIQ